jgi:hypothetical protein
LVCLEFWLHLISGMGSEYCQGQPLIVGLVVFFPGGRKYPARNLGKNNPGSMSKLEVGIALQPKAARLENAKSGKSVEDIRSQAAAESLRPWVNKGVYSVYISVQYYSSSNA